MHLNQFQKQIVQMLFAMIILVIASLIRIIRPENLYWNIVLFLLVYIIYISMAVVWLLSLHHRIMQKNLRRHLIGTAVLICFWILLRSIRHRLLWDGVVSRYAWYGYYIPMILIPLLSFYAALCMGKREDYNIPARWKLLWIPAVVLILGILTNEFHHLAFRIVAENPEQYSRGVLYLCAAIWIAILESSTIVLLLRKSLILNIGKEKLLPFAVLGLAGFYCLLYAINMKTFGFIEMTAALALFHACIWESCIAIGTVPVNTNYEEFFYHSGLKMQIVDWMGKVCYRSEHQTLDICGYLEDIRQGRVILPDEDTELHSAPVQGGYIVWQEDISQLNELIREKQRTEQVLREQTELMQREYEIESRRMQIQKMNGIYQLVAEETREKCGRILFEVEKLKKINEIEAQRRQLIRIHMEGVYIKRRCNLLMIRESMGRIPVEELHFCFEESLNNLEICGVKASLLMQLKGSLHEKTAVLLYDILEEVMEQILFTASRVYVVLAEDNHRIMKLSIFIYSLGKITDIRMPAVLDQPLQEHRVAYFFKKEEDAEYLFSVRFPGR